MSDYGVDQRLKVSVDVGQILTAALMLFAQYKQARASVEAAGNPTDASGAMLSDADLIGLLKLDAVTLQAKIADRIAQYSLPPDTPPTA